LICFQRSADEAVPGCSGPGLSTEDYCIKPWAGTLVLMGDEDQPAENFPLGECEGGCDNASDCEVRAFRKYSLSCSILINQEHTHTVSHLTLLISHFQRSLLCSQRSGIQAVPGCSGAGQSGKDYCYDPNPDSSPTTAPTSVGQRTGPPVITPPPGTVTYVPGEATVYENGLLLSTGLTSRIIATKNTKVQYDTVGESSEDFHSAPDGKHDGCCVDYCCFIREPIWLTSD
jgi:hypothetical protein